MKKPFITVLATLALASCEVGGPIAADGYRFEKAEWDRPGMNIEFKPYGSVHQLRMAYKGDVPPKADLMAWGQIWPERNTCLIHYVDPEVQYAPEWIGHEIVHCLKGRWHGAKVVGRS